MMFTFSLENNQIKQLNCCYLGLIDLIDAGLHANPRLHQ